MIPPDLIDTPKLSGLDDGQRRTVLEKAQFAALARAPATPEAKALVEAVASRLESLEGELEARQRQRGKAAHRFRQAVGAFLADLLMAPGGNIFGGLVHRANDPDAFTGEAVGYRQFAAVRQGLLLARYCIAAGNKKAAVRLLQSLYGQLEKWELLDWEPELSARIISLLLSLQPKDRGSGAELMLSRLHWLHLATAVGSIKES